MDGVIPSGIVQKRAVSRASLRRGLQTSLGLFAAALLTGLTGVVHAQSPPVPQAVSAKLAELATVCRKTGRQPEGRGHLSPVDLNGDRVLDYVIDQNRYQCGAGNYLFASKTGAPISVYLTAPNGTARLIYAKITPVVLVTKPANMSRLLLSFSGSDCDSPSPQARCRRELAWDPATRAMKLGRVLPTPAPASPSLQTAQAGAAAPGARRALGSPPPQRQAKPGSWREVLTQRELAALPAMIRAEKLDLETRLAAAQRSSSPAAIDRMVQGYPSEINSLNALIELRLYAMNDSKSDAEAGLTRSADYRAGFVKFVAEREARLSIDVKSYAAQAPAIRAEMERQRLASVAAQKAERDRAYAASMAAAAEARRPVLIDGVPRTANTIETPADYLKDDGVMSRAEMAEESRDMNDLCLRNQYLRIFVNCAGYTEEFLRQRIAKGPRLSQTDIYNLVTNSAESRPNYFRLDEIKKRSFNACRAPLQYSREFPQSRIPSHCECIAGKVMADFTQQPRAIDNYIDGLTARAMRQKACG